MIDAIPISALQRSQDGTLRRPCRRSCDAAAAGVGPRRSGSAQAPAPPATGGGLRSVTAMPVGRVATPAA